MLNSVSLHSNSINESKLTPKQQARKAEVDAQIKEYIMYDEPKSGTHSEVTTNKMPSGEALKAMFIPFTSSEPKLTPEKQARKAEVDAQIKEYIMLNGPKSGTHSDVKTDKISVNKLLSAIDSGKQRVMLQGLGEEKSAQLAKTIADEVGAPLVTVSTKDFSSDWVGVGASKVKEAFSEVINQANSNDNKTAFIFINDLEVFNEEHTVESRELAHTFNQLLTEMDNLKKNKDLNIVVIGSTNEANNPRSLMVRFDQEITL